MSDLPEQIPGQTTTALVVRSANRVNDSTFERIWKFYYEKTDIELKEKEEEIRKRLTNIWALLGDILTDRKAVQAHIQWCQDNGYRIKERMAYEDLRYAKKLFGDRRLQTKSAQRAIMSELLLNRINRLIKYKDPDTGEIHDVGDDEVLVKLIKEYNELNGLKDNNTMASAERVVVNLNFNSDPEKLKEQIAEMRRRAESANAQDADFKEVE
jgi:hypothetical protein